jgi:hypothetical protein
MKPTRTTARLTLLAITVFASLALMAPATHALDLVSAPLSGGGFACSVVNASDRTQMITLDILDIGGRSLLGGPGTPGPLASGQIASGGFGFGGTTQAYCTVSSQTAKRGDLKLGFCNTGPERPDCIAAVSAE